MNVAFQLLKRIKSWLLMIKRIVSIVKMFYKDHYFDKQVPKPNVFLLRKITLKCLKYSFLLNPLVKKVKVIFTKTNI